LIPELLTQLPLKGNPVAIVQARSALLVTGSEDMEGLALIAQCALDDFPENERAVSLTPIEWRGGAWVALGIEDRHPQQLKNLRAHQLGWTYGATGEALQQQLGDDIFVASVLLIERDGKTFTAASWATGVRTACPLVETLILQEDGVFPGIRRSLDDVMTVCGPFAEVEAMPYPRRWLLPAQIPDVARRDLTDNYSDHPFFAE
jgi:hypothetical protein